VGIQGSAIHQERRNTGKVLTQLVEDGKAVSVDISPIVRFAKFKPAGFGKSIPAISRTENDYCAGNRREGQEVGFVFRDEDLSNIQFKPAKTISVQRDVRA